MRQIILTFILIFSMGCATTKPPVSTLLPLAYNIEQKELPPEPTEKDLSQYPGSDKDVIPVFKGQITPIDGILVSERRAALDGQFRIDYKQLRLLYKADRIEWVAQRALYEDWAKKANDKIAELQPTWFQEHKGELGFLLGLTVGIVIPVTVIIYFK